MNFGNNELYEDAMNFEHFELNHQISEVDECESDERDRQQQQTKRFLHEREQRQRWRRLADRFNHDIEIVELNNQLQGIVNQVQQQTGHERSLQLERKNKQIRLLKQDFHQLERYMLSTDYKNAFEYCCIFRECHRKLSGLLH